MSDIDTFHCGSCGADLPRRLEHARMITCTHCGTTSVLRDEAFEIAGEGGVMQDTPSLITLGRHVQAGRARLLPVGHARFSYGRGWWDEYWCLNDHGDGRWLSADEGDYAVERDLDPPEWPKGFKPSLGKVTEINGDTYTVTEAETASCLAVRGEFPEELEIGEAHLYFDLSGPDGKLATYEKWDGGEGWSVGKWIDPWDVYTHD